MSHLQGIDNMSEKRTFIKSSQKRKGKIVYTPPEKSFTDVNIEETDHGFKIYRLNESRPFTVIPHSSVRQILYKRDDNR